MDRPAAARNRDSQSDILPVIAIGSRAVFIPYRTTWIYERTAEEELDAKQYIELERHAGFPPANEGKLEACATKNLAVMPALPQARDSFSRVIVMYVCTPSP
ncbi:MAG: hypothetical protein ONB43_23900 [candidate division KSB1 bacterium]|nr:hypothetical protein [candidate division KSB1 bacterium]MDZ7406860.1 hypothetical protein [candidate division KSB1 bacterium]